jgi:hypothetical protein
MLSLSLSLSLHFSLSISLWSTLRLRLCHCMCGGLSFGVQLQPEHSFSSVAKQQFKLFIFLCFRMVRYMIQVVFTPSHNSKSLIHVHCHSKSFILLATREQSFHSSKSFIFDSKPFIQALRWNGVMLSPGTSKSLVDFPEVQSTLGVSWTSHGGLGNPSGSSRSFEIALQSENALETVWARFGKHTEPYEASV